MLKVFYAIPCLEFVSPVVIVAHIARDVKHPRSEIALSPEEVAVFQNPHKGVLHQVFAEFLAPVEVVEKAEKRLFIPLEKQAQFVKVVIPDFQHQCIV